VEVFLTQLIEVHFEMNLRSLLDNLQKTGEFDKNDKAKSHNNKNIEMSKNIAAKHWISIRLDDVKLTKLNYLSL
jgi:hypothetical protein